MLQSIKDVCQLCGKRAFRLQKAHIVDKTADGDSSRINLLLCCPSCHSAFDNILKPKLYKVLRNAKVQKLPISWEHPLEARNAIYLNRTASRHVSRQIPTAIFAVTGTVAFSESTCSRKMTISCVAATATCVLIKK